jgi:hypothetical protein
VHLCTCFPVSESTLAFTLIDYPCCLSLFTSIGAASWGIRRSPRGAIRPHRKMFCARPPVWRIQPECDTSWSKHRPCQAPRWEFRRGVGRNPSSRTSWDSPAVVRDVALEATYRQCKGHHVRQGSDGHYVKNTRHRVRNTCNWQSLYLLHSCDALRRRDTRRTSYATTHCRGGVSCTAAGGLRAVD